MLLEPKSLNDVLNDTTELRANGDWLCLNIEPKTAWPIRPQSFTFEGHVLWLMPLSTDNHPGIAFNRSANLSRDDAWALLHRALSLIAWTQNTGAVVASMSGGNLPRMMGLAKARGFTLCDDFDFSDLPQIESGRAQLALALMREGRGLNHPAYAFLSFCRVLETAIPDGKKRGAWVTTNIDNIEGHRAKEALEKLKESVRGDIGEHLRDSGRNAIAHAKADPIINPDNPRDAKRLQAELPIIEALAVLAVERQLGVQTSHAIWKEHLYELRGWKIAFGEQVIVNLLEGNFPAEGQNFDAPILNVRLRRSSPFTPLEGMVPQQSSYDHGKVELVYRSEDELVDLIFWLNFAAERLEFDPLRSVIVRDDGTPQAARNRKEIDRFMRDYFANGELQMWDYDTHVLVSRCEAFMPLNFRFDFEAANAAIDRWDATIAERELAAAAR